MLFRSMMHILSRSSPRPPFWLLQMRSPAATRDDYHGCYKATAGAGLSDHRRRVQRSSAYAWRQAVDATGGLASATRCHDLMLPAATGLATPGSWSCNRGDKELHPAAIFAGSSSFLCYNRHIYLVMRFLFCWNHHQILLELPFSVATID